MRDEYTRQWHAAHEAELGKETLMEMATYRGPSYDDVKPHLWNFFQAVRSRQPIVQDAVFGHHAAAACHMANESYFLKKPVMFDPATDSIRS
jgi:hypothetical protein